MGPSPPSNVSQTTRVELGPEQRQLFDLGFPYLQEYSGTPLQQFQGTGIADFSELERQGQQAYLAQAGPAADIANSARGGYDAAQALNQNVLGNEKFQLDVANNPYLRDAVLAMTGGINQNLLETQLPATRAGATQAGGMYSGASSKAGLAEGAAIGNTNRAISDAVAEMMFKQYNAGMGNLNQSVANAKGLTEAAPTLQHLGMTAPDIISGVGGQQRAMEQARLDEIIQKFYAEQALPLLQGQEMISLINGMPGGATTSTGSGLWRPQQSPFMMGLGALSLGSQIFGGGAGAGGGGLLGGLGALAALL